MREWLIDVVGIALDNKAWLVAALACVILVQIWWHKHPGRSMIMSALMGMILYAAMIALIALGLSYWPTFRVTLPRAQVIYWLYGAIAAAFVVANIVWWRFLQWLKLPPKAH